MSDAAHLLLLPRLLLLLLLLSDPRYCVLDEVCVHLRRRPLLLLPSLAASGSGCLLTRDNIQQFLEGGVFVDPRLAHKQATAGLRLLLLLLLVALCCCCRLC